MEQEASQPWKSGTNGPDVRLASHQEREHDKAAGNWMLQGRQEKLHTQLNLLRRVRVAA